MSEQELNQTQTEPTSEPTKEEEKKLIDICLDATMLDTYVVCPAKFNYRFNMQKTTPTKPPPLDRGGLEHNGFEGYYKELQKGTEFSNALEAGIVEFNKATVESDLDPTEITQLRKALIESITYWKQTDARYEILAVEEPFSYVLHQDDTIRVTMIGKIDLLINEQRLGIHPVDHKTYSRDFPLRRRTYQFCNYVYATKSPYLLVNRVGLQTSLPVEKKHKRQPLSYDPIFLEQWKQDVIKWCYAYLFSVIDNSWPTNNTSCDKYNRICEYNEVCDSSGVEAKLYKLSVDFKDSGKWDVAKSLGLDK